MAALVRVRNVGDTAFVDSWQGNDYVIPAGQEIIMEAEGPCLWLGYPGLRDDPLRADFKRTDQYARLRARLGFHGGPAGQTEKDWERMRPKLEVYKLDTNERVYMILDDPTGELDKGHLVDAPVTGNEDTAYLEERLESQQREIDALRTLVEARQGNDEPLPEQVAEDTPRQVPVGARGGKSKG